MTPSDSERLRTGCVLSTHRFLSPLDTRSEAFSRNQQPDMRINPGRSQVRRPQGSSAPPTRNASPDADPTPGTVCSAGRTTDSFDAARTPAFQPGARPPADTSIESISSPVRALHQQTVHVEFHTSPAP